MGSPPVQWFVIEIDSNGCSLATPFHPFTANREGTAKIFPQGDWFSAERFLERLIKELDLVFR